MSKSLIFLVIYYCLVTAVGGGTLRDVMIGTTPVGWMLDLEYVYVICIAFALALVFRKNSRDCVRHYFYLTPLD
jgi:uncharacterized membrane protein YeiH